MIPLPPPKPYYPFEAKPFKVAMGLHPLNLAEWIEIDDKMPDQLAEKRRLLAERPDEVFAALPEGLSGSKELLALLVERLTTQFPEIYQLNGRRLTNYATNETWDLDQATLHPLDLAGRLVQEDLCLMRHDPAVGIYRLVAASLCFPTRWRLDEKLGRSLATIHQPTPHYAKNIGSPMDKLFARLKVNRPMWRTNWNVLDDGALFQPEGHSRKDDYPTEVTAENVGERVWLRIERQTLHRLPHSQDILFTIRIYNAPFSSLREKPEVAGRLAGAIRGKDPAMLHYKSMYPILEPTLEWLDKTASQTV